MKGRTVGLDVGATSIKAVWVTRDKDKFILDSAISNPTPPKGMLSESPLDQEEMANAIKSLIGRSRIPTSYANIALPESQVFTKVLEMPVLTDKELSSAIYWEAEQYIPVPLANMTLDWKVLSKSTDPQGPKMQVLLVGAQTSLIEKYQKVLGFAGLAPHAVETEIISTIRALSSISNFPNTLIVHIGTVSTSLAIIKAGTIVFTYSIPTGGNAMTRAIASDFGFAAPQAEQYKKTYGVSGQALGGKVGQAIVPILGSLVTEVKKALAFYNEKYKNDQPVSQILLSGGSAKLPGIDSFFVDNCAIETVVANPWAIFGSQQLPKDILDSGAEFAIAIGLAMRGLE